MEEGGERTSLLIKDDASCHGDESQNLLETRQGSQLKSKRSDWRAPALILGLECLESMAFNGIATNLVVYIRSVLHGGIASSASTVSLWFGTSFFVPILGAAIADTYLGNYKTILISLIMYLLGMVLITVAAFMPSTSVSCDMSSSCLSSDGTQNLIFFVALYLTAVGCGGVRSALLPFGADQFNNEHSLDIKRRRNFFSSFYICVIIQEVEIGEALKRMKGGKAMGPDGIPVEVWR